MNPAEIERLERRHSDIARLGAGVLALVQRREDAAARHQAFVDQHGLKCFKCGTGLNPWAATGTSEYGRPWAICTVCVRRPR